MENLNIRETVNKFMEWVTVGRDGFIIRQYKRGVLTSNRYTDEENLGVQLISIIMGKGVMYILLV